MSRWLRPFAAPDQHGSLRPIPLGVGRANEGLPADRPPPHQCCMGLESERLGGCVESLRKGFSFFLCWKPVMQRTLDWFGLSGTSFKSLIQLNVIRDDHNG